MSKIIKLISENIKRLNAVEITPNGNLVVLGGENGAGKSSVLDSIAMAIGGGDKIPGKPLRDGAKSGRVQVTLEDLIITRKFLESGTTSLTVEGMDGSRHRSPQGVLDALVGALSFDPLEFMRQKPGEQAETLRKLAGVDFTELDKKRAVAFETRTETNRDVKRLEGAVNSKYSFADAPKELQDAGAITEEIRIVNEKNNANQLRRSELQQLVSHGQQMSSSLEEAKARTERLRKELAEAEKSEETAEQSLKKSRDQYNSMSKEVKALADLDTAPLLAKLAAVDEINAKVRANMEKAGLASELADATKLADKLSEEIREIDGEKRRLISESPLPIDGLLFDQEGVTYKGYPLDQSSGAEQLRISMGIAAAMNPTLKVMLCKDAALLDDSSFKLVSEFAEERGYQIWMEDCRAGDRATVTIVDGHSEEVTK